MSGLHPGDNRVDYGDLLAAPDGFRFDKALATTYSLDLTTLVAMPLALHYGQNMDGDFSEPACELLDSVRKAASRMRIFHQHGKISVPGNYNRLLALFDRCLVGIRLDENQPFSSFHPKVWLVRYQADKGQACYRLIVTSRNLTDSRDWDLVVSFDSDTNRSESQPQNDPISNGIVRMLAELAQANADIDEDSAKFFAPFLEELPSLTWQLPENCHQASFHWSTPKAPQIPLNNQEGSELLCITPFLDFQTLKALQAMASDKITLLSRDIELNLLGQADWLQEHFDTKVLTKIVEDGAMLEEDARVANTTSSIHAKCYLLDSGELSYLSLGSSNATQAARRMNTEAFVTMTFDRKALSARELRKTLFEDDDVAALFCDWAPVAADDSDRKAEQNFHKLLHAFLQLPVSVQATQQDGEHWSLSIQLENPDATDFPGISIQMAPLVREHDLRALDLHKPEPLLFNQLKVADLSGYILVAARCVDLPEKRFLLNLDVSGLPEDRDAYIVRSMFDTEEKFLRYCRFLLLADNRKTIPDLSDSPLRQFGNSASAITRMLSHGMFEELLTSASRYPERLRDMQQLIEQLTDHPDTRDVIPESFINLWSRFSAWLPEQAPT